MIKHVFKTKKGNIEFHIQYDISRDCYWYMLREEPKEFKNEVRFEGWTPRNELFQNLVEHLESVPTKQP